MVNRLTDEMVRSAVYMWLRKNDPELFDAWLAEVKAKAWDEGVKSTCMCCYDDENPYRSEQ